MEKEFSPFGTLNDLVVRCTRCPRLVYFREHAPKKKEFEHQTYWRKPVPGFGDPRAWLLIFGLAPSQQGANRTGRVFTGDASGRFLIKALYKTGLANQPTSLSKEDGLQLIGCYITAAVKCVPPSNRPLKEEFYNCASYFENEFFLLTHLKAILALGKDAYEASSKFLTKESGFPISVPFHHSAKVELPNWPTLWASFHPSPQNTNTGRLTEEMFCDLIQKIQKEI